MGHYFLDILYILYYYSTTITTWFILPNTVYQSLDPFYIVSFYTKWIKTSWPDSRIMCNITISEFLMK